jgi:hypothetical protein
VEESSPFYRFSFAHLPDDVLLPASGRMRLLPAANPSFGYFTMASLILTLVFAPVVLITMALARSVA